jgi:hypothetical protein
MFFVFFYILRVDQYVIDFHHNKLDLILHKVHVHQIHVVVRTSINPKYITVYLYGPFLKMKADIGWSYFISSADPIPIKDRF